MERQAQQEEAERARIAQIEVHLKLNCRVTGIALAGVRRGPVV